MAFGEVRLLPLLGCCWRRKVAARIKISAKLHESRTMSRGGQFIIACDREGALGSDLVETLLLSVLLPSYLLVDVSLILLRPDDIVVIRGGREWIR